MRMKNKKAEQEEARKLHKEQQKAKRIYEQLDHQNPANEESSTTLFRLVDYLIQYR